MGRSITLFLALAVITFGISSCKKGEQFGANRTSTGYFPSNPGCVWVYDNDDDIYSVRPGVSDTSLEGGEYVPIITDLPGGNRQYYFLQYDKKSEETVIYDIREIYYNAVLKIPVQYIKPKANVGDEWTVNAPDLVIEDFDYTEKNRVTFKVIQKGITKNILGVIYSDCIVMERTTSSWSTLTNSWGTSDPTELVYSKGVGLIYTSSGTYRYNYPAQLLNYAIY